MAPEKIKRKLAAVLSADVKSYRRLMDRGRCFEAMNAMLKFLRILTGR